MRRYSRLSVYFIRGLVLCMLFTLLTGCGNASVEESESVAETTAYEAELAKARAAMEEVMSSDAADKMEFDFDYDPAECIKVDEGYQNLEISAEESAVSDEEVDYEAEALCEQYAEEQTVSDRPAQTGDTLVIDFEGTEDGKTICKETDYELTLGEDDNNKNFEEAVTGASTGDTVTTSITYSEDTGDENLMGKTVDYKITVKSIKQVTLPELDDELVKAHTEYDTVAAYKKGLRERLEKEQVMDVIDGWLTDHSELISAPDSLVEKYKEELVAYYSYVGEYYGNQDLDSVLKDAGYDSEEDMFKDNEDSIQDSVSHELIYSYIIQQQKLSSTMGEYQEFLKQKAEQDGCSEISELLILYSEDDLRLQFMETLADQWIYERCTIR